MNKEYTIGQICKLYNLGPDSIRYYEKKDLSILKEDRMDIEYTQ